MKVWLKFFSMAIAANALFIGFIGTLNIIFDQDWGIRLGAEALLLPKYPGELASIVVCLLLLAGLLEASAHAGSLFQKIKQKPAMGFGLIAVSTLLLVIGGNFALTLIMGGPLQRAVEMGDTQQVIQLVKQNSYEPKDLSKPLYFALKQADYSMAEALLDEGADVNNIDDGEFETPLLVSSVFHFEPDATAFLLSHGADPNLQDNLGRTAMVVAVSYRKEEALNFLEMLHGAGGNMAMETENGETVATIAARNNNPSVIDYLDKIAVQSSELSR